MEPDIVIPVRVGEVNLPLRYALRSIAAHVPHRRVWVAGHMPAWVRNVGHIPTRQDAGTKYANSRANWRAAVDHPEVSDRMLVFNDDFFVMKPIREVPVLHRGPLTEVQEVFARRVRPGRYMEGMEQTRRLLADCGIDDPLCYEVHTPFEIERERYLEVWDIAQRIPLPHSRTLYGNLHRIGGQRVRDPKVMMRGPGFDRDATFLSTLPDSFARGHVGVFIRSKFPAACRYEAASVRAVPRAVR